MQDAPTLPALFIFVKWTVQSELIHSAHLLTRNSAVILFTCTVHVNSKKSIFFKCVLLKKKTSV